MDTNGSKQKTKEVVLKVSFCVLVDPRLHKYINDITGAVTLVCQPTTKKPTTTTTYTTPHLILCKNKFPYTVSAQWTMFLRNEFIHSYVSPASLMLISPIVNYYITIYVLQGVPTLFERGVSSRPKSVTQESS